MDYSPLVNIMRITDDSKEMAEIGRVIEKELPDLYTPLMMEKMYEGVDRHIPNACPEKKEEMVYRAIYDYWAYGANVDEEFYYHFDEKTHQKKQQYLCGYLRGAYVCYLNANGDMTRLSDKYRLYQDLKPLFLREMISINNEDDFSAFEQFAKKHDVFVVKPVDFWYGIGVHKASLSDYDGDVRAAFTGILNEGKTIQDRHPSRASKMVLEELIIQDPALEKLHPQSVNAVRATAVRGKDGKIHLYHPWIKVGMNGAFVASAALDGFDAEIDPKTGVVITDGFQENGKVYEVHPNSGIRIKGFQIPKWNELIEMVDQLMEALPEFGYIGWDLVLTPKGWCVMEGNSSGEFIFQLFNGHGFREEFEELIGWKYEKDFWWERFLND